MTDNNRHTPPRRPQRLRLPFDNRREDAGEWAYDHRIGLCVTIIVYLLLGIAFVGSKITLGARSHTQGIYIDLHTAELLEDERDRLQEEVRRNNSAIDWKSIRNAQSNENALNENLADDRGTRTSELNAQASDVSADMQANREAYERGLAEADALGRRAADDGTAADEKLTDRKLSNVTVSFSLKDPVRYKRELAVPAYRCEGGGEVVVAITVDRGGRVVAASVASGGDECMREASVQAARASLFNIDESAPARQTGSITYIFIPQ
ncbi:MAG: energy transducer TonB [Alistipes sp.]|nr:energy transducer TonB [Alistipes sp.]